MIDLETPMEQAFLVAVDTGSEDGWTAGELDLGMDLYLDRCADLLTQPTQHGLPAGFRSERVRLPWGHARIQTRKRKCGQG
jgi:hypothetical protein